MTTFNDFKKTAKSKVPVKNSTISKKMKRTSKASLQPNEVKNGEALEIQKQEVATKTTTFKDYKESRYGDLPSMNEANNSNINTGLVITET
jgi:hypothetical protein